MIRLLLALAATLAALPAAAHPLIVRGDRLFVAVTVNGVGTEALLDSGAELSVLDDDFATELGLTNSGEAVAKGSGGEAKASFAKGVAIKAPDAVLADRTVGIIDLADISKRLVGAPVRMILGRDYFDSGRFEVNIEGGTIRALPAGTTPRGRRLPLTTRAGVETLPIAIEGHDGIEAMFDLGNGTDMTIGAGAAGKLKLTQPGRITERRHGGGIGGGRERDYVKLATVTIGGRTFHDVAAAIETGDEATEANVGVRLLRSFVIVTDFPGRAVWLRAR